MKIIYQYLLLSLITGCSLSCQNQDDDDTNVPDPGKNVAGAVAGTYKVNTVLSGTTGASSLVSGAMTGSGTLTLTVVNDSTVTYRNQTELTVTATGKKISLNEDIKVCRVGYDKSYGQIYLSQPIRPGVETAVGRVIMKNRINLSRYRQEGYDVSVEYKR